MEKVQNQAQIGATQFRGNYQGVQNPVHDNTARNITNGDKKSMDILKAAGVIAAGTLAVAGIIKYGPKAISKIKNKASDVGQKVSKKAGKKTAENVSKKAQKLEILKNQKGKIVERRIGGKPLTFDNGKALLDGKAYTGTYKINGTRVTYENGVKTKMVKKAKAGQTGFKKLYNENGQIIKSKFTDSAGATTVKKYKYTSDGNLKKVLDNDGNILEKYHYNKHGQLTKWTEGKNEYVAEFSKSGRRKSVTKNGKPFIETKKVEINGKKGILETRLKKGQPTEKRFLLKDGKTVVSKPDAQGNWVNELFKENGKKAKDVGKWANVTLG